ncbi:TPA: hypothetical protein L5D69_002326 [Pseudomonas aeruginosa]|nr:hypothetical protein [Pseudomonas aeruginosa]
MSTQYQLIEQCTIRLRGIVEALDNIHDTSPQRWSTDLDDVHSSAESLLALINDQAPTLDSQGLAGAALAQPSPTPELPERGTQHRFSTNEQNCRHDFAGVWWNDNGVAQTGRECRHCGFFVADVTKARSEQAEAERLREAYEWGYGDGQNNPNGYSDKKERDACVNELLKQPSPAQAEQAEAERPEVVAWRYGSSGGIVSDKACLDEWKSGGEYQSLMTVAQHERIVKAWIERWKAYIELSAKIAAQRDAADARLHEVATACATAEEERDAALARVAELEMLLRELNTSGLMQFSTADEEKAVRAALSGAQAQHSAGYAEARMCANCRHIGINDAADYAACHDCNWTGPEPDEDKCPGCAGENCMAAACPECGGRYDLVAEANITAPAGQVPQAWLDVQAERLRQVEAEGWMPEHDDAHSHGQMARAAACYALAGSSAPNDGTAALLVSLAWPWDEQWWKPSTARRDMVKACALGLAEIERLDRAAATQGGPRDA